MALLDQQARDQITKLFAELEEPVKLVLYTQQRSPLVIPGRQECESCEEAEQLLEELTALSDKLTLETHDVRAEPEAVRTAEIHHLPALVLQSPKAAGRLRFFGMPGGYEFSTLIADIVDLSRGNIELSETTQAELRGVTEPLHIQVFVTPT